MPSARETHADETTVTPIPPAEPLTAPRRPAGAGALGSAQRLLTRYKVIVRILVLATIVTFLGVSLGRSWSTLTSYHWHAEWGAVFAAFLLLVAQEVSFGFIWRAILASMGSRIDIIASQRMYLGAEFVRYIPGNVWHVLTRVYWAEQRGVPKAIGFASMVVELATKIVAAALVFALSLIFWGDTGALTTRIPHGALVGVGVVLVPLLLLGLYPPLLRGALNTLLRRMGRQPVTFALRYSDMLLITGYWALSWIVAGAGFFLLVRALVATPLPAAALPIAIGIYALGWDVGFLSFVTPSGVGFREGAIVFLLASAALAPAAPATVIAILGRVLATGAELVCIGVAHAIPGTPLAPPSPRSTT